MDITANYGIPVAEVKRIEGDQASSVMQLQDLGDFLKLFVAQMENQDPLKPADGSEFFSQTAQITMVEQLLQMNQKNSDTKKALDSLDRSFSSAYLGAYATGTSYDEKGDPHEVSGFVSDIYYDDKGKPTLGLATGEKLELKDIKHLANHA